MKWNHVNVIKIIEAYREKPVLWDQNKKNHFNPVDKRQAWAQLSSELNYPIPELKNKISNILGQLRREKKKRRRFIAEGNPAEEFKSSWYAYDYLRFLVDTSNDNNERQPKTEYVDVNSDTLESNDENMDSDEPASPVMNTYTESKKDEEKNETNINFEPAPTPADDECQLYANYIASKLRSYSKHTKNVLQHHIGNLLFEADNGDFERK